jgi:hypothetical protein
MPRPHPATRPRAAPPGPRPGPHSPGPRRWRRHQGPDRGRQDGAAVHEHPGWPPDPALDLRGPAQAPLAARPSRVLGPDALGRLCGPASWVPCARQAPWCGFLGPMRSPSSWPSFLGPMRSPGSVSRMDLGVDIGQPWTSVFLPPVRPRDDVAGVFGGVGWHSAARRDRGPAASRPHAPPDDGPGTPTPDSPDPSGRHPANAADDGPHTRAGDGRSR